nr:MAG TPA: hypothetical protein [Bacteriophage sp.]
MRPASSRKLSLSNFMLTAGLTYNLPQMGLTCKALQSKYRVRFMASVIGNNAATPLRPTDGFATS